MKKAINVVEPKVWLFIFRLAALIRTNGAFMWVQDEQFELKVTKTKKLLALFKKLWRERFGEDLETNILDRVVEVLNMILSAENHTLFWPAMAVAELNADLKYLLHRGDFGQVLQLLLIAKHANPFVGPEEVEVYSDGMELPCGPISRPEFKNWLSDEYQKRFSSKPSKTAIAAAVKAVQHIALENHKNTKHWSLKVFWAKKNIGSHC